MLTRTLPSPETKSPQPPLTKGSETENTESPEFIEEKVDERGFYLYEWISPDELRMSVQADYLSIIRAASMPLAVVTIIAGLMWLAAGPIGVILAVLWVLTVFYLIVGIILVLKMLRKSYLYTRGANVVITDNHYVSLGEVVERENFARQKEVFSTLEKVFREPLLEPSGLAEHIAMEKKWLMNQLKEIAMGWWKVMQNLGRSRDAGGIIMVLMVAWVLYGVMMAAVYFIGVFFVSLMARIFAWIAHRALLATNNTEHRIQTLFTEIYESSLDLKKAKKTSISLLTEAGANEWAKSLSSRLEKSFELMNARARLATDDAVELRKLLESSQYRDIFNFVKYGNWIRTQILAPIDEIYLLLTSHHATLESTVLSLDRQITGSPPSKGGQGGNISLDPSLQKPLILQRERIVVQLESMERIMTMLEGYKERLTMKINN